MASESSSLHRPTGLRVSPSNEKKFISLGIVHSIFAAATSSSDLRAHHISKLGTVGFYFCLRSCKYTNFTSHRWKFQFWPCVDFVLFVV